MHIDSIATWLWNFGDGSQPVTTPVTATHTYTAPGTYITTLTVTDLHGCMNSVFPWHKSKSLADSSVQLVKSDLLWQPGTLYGSIPLYLWDIQVT